MNVQFAIQNGVVYVLEVNPRASRTAPFVSKATGRAIAKIGAQVMTGRKLAELGATEEIVPTYFSVKEAVFPFAKFPESDPILGPEMKSTGEVMGTGRTFGEAYAKAQTGFGHCAAAPGTALISVRERDKPGAVAMARKLIERGFDIVATDGTAKAIVAAGLACKRVNKVREGRPHIVDMIKNDEIDLIVNTTEGRQATRDSMAIRREAVSRRVTYFTTLAAGLATCEALDHLDDVDVNRLQDLHKEVAEHESRAHHPARRRGAAHRAAQAQVARRVRMSSRPLPRRARTATCPRTPSITPRASSRASSRGASRSWSPSFPMPRSST